MEKKIIVLGGIGRSERENRDCCRVIFRGGQCFALKSHIDKEPPYLVRRYEKSKSNRSDGQHNG